MLLIVAQLFFAPAVRLVNGQLHRLRNAVSIHDDAAIDIAGGATGCLRERAVAAEKALFVCVEDGDERDFGQVEPLTQKVDADKDVISTGAQVVHDAHPVERVHITVDIGRADAFVRQVVRQFLSHTLGERRDKCALTALNALTDLFKQVVNLVQAGAYLDDRVEQACRTDHLLDHHSPALLKLVVCWRGADIDHLTRHLLEFLELQGTVVERRRQAETIVDKRLLA
ncbi:unknown [Prevotella sp. CAG:755]|nr:unknown [Prevotella sp. CAG:755]